MRVAAALSLPALLQAAFAEAVFASDDDWLREDESTQWTEEVVVRPTAPAAGHSVSPGEVGDDRLAATAPPGPALAKIILSPELVRIAQCSSSRLCYDQLSPVCTLLVLRYTPVTQNKTQLAL